MAEQKTNYALTESLLNVGLGKVTVKDIGDFTFEDIDGGREPLFMLDNHGYYWHQSGYGCLSAGMVTIVPNAKLRGGPITEGEQENER